MVFEISGKVAIVTGGASGIGYQFVKEILRNGAKGVTLADMNVTNGEKALQELTNEFGAEKVLFVQTDVRNFQLFEATFEKTIEKYGNVDILVNNAGILNGALWEEEIAINVKGTINGILLAYDKYLPKHKRTDEALIVNVSSVAGCDPFGFSPTYTGTKHAVIGLTKSWGVPEFYEESHVRVVAVCPGATLTSLLLDAGDRNLGGKYEKFFRDNFDAWPTQGPEFIAQEAMRVFKYAPNGTIWVIEGGEPAYQYDVPHRTTMKGNILKC